MKEKFLKLAPIITPFLVLLFVFHSLMNEYTVKFEESFISQGEEFSTKPTVPKVNRESGVISRIFYLESFLENLESQHVTVDTDLEETKDSIKRVLVGQKIYLFLLIFYFFLALSTLFTSLFSAWFYKHLAAIFYPLTILTLLPKIFYQGNLIYHGDLLSILYLLLFLGIYVFSIISVHLIGKDKRPEKFSALQFSSSLEEEGRSPTSTKTGSIFAPIVHFFFIILIGILIGNFIYIPLFLLQKHFVSEFSFFIFFVLGTLSIFYVFNYKKVGGEESNKPWQNILVSFAYLQFRFLRNSFAGAFGLVLVVFFVTFLFSLLLFNIDLIQSNLGLFGKSTEF